MGWDRWFRAARAMPVAPIITQIGIAKRICDGHYDRQAGLGGRGRHEVHLLAWDECHWHRSRLYERREMAARYRGYAWDRLGCLIWPDGFAAVDKRPRGCV